jgi:hypothetical protein
MPFKFNPFSGNFDQTGSGGGGGASYIDGEVQNFSALPQTIGSPAVDSAYLVREAEGAWLLNRKPAGIYIRTANTGVRASDWTHASAFPDVFNDANLVVYANGDSSKNAKFDVSAIATGATRTISVPNKNVTLDDAGDSRTPSSHAASHAAGVKASFFGTVNGMTGTVWIVADNAGTAGNSITLSFNGSQTIANRLSAWNSANPSNTAALGTYGGNGSQIPNNGQQIVLSGGTNAGSDALPYDSTPRFDSLVVGGNSIGSWIQSGEMLSQLNAADGTSAVPLVMFGGAALFEVFQDSNLSSGFAHGLAIPGNSPDGTYRLTLYNGSAWNPKIIVPQTGAVEISENLKLADLDNGFAATFGAQSNLSDDRTYDLPDASGTLALTTTAPASHTHGNLTNDGKVGSDSGRVLVTTTAGAVTTLALGTANQVLRTKSDLSGVEFADPSGGGVTGAAASAADVLGVSGANITGVDAGSDKIVFWDDSASELTYLTVGSGLSLTDTTLTATATGGGTKTYATFTAEHNQPPSTAFATLDTRNSIAVLDFDAATDENAVFVGIMPEAASLGSGLIVRLHWMATTATSGNVRWGVQFERSNTDLDSDSFDTAVEATAAANGTSGILTTTAITVTTIDGITAGDVFRLKVFRNADDATNDTMTGDAELVAVEVRSAA